MGKNYFYNLMYQISILISPLITMPYVSRVLGAENIGLYSYTNTVVAYFVLAANLGSGSYAQKQIAICDKDIISRSRVFFNVICFRTVVFIVVTAGYLVYLLNEKHTDIRMLLQVQGLALISAFLDISWLFQGMQNFRLTAMRSVLFKLIGVIAVFLLVSSAEDLIIYVGVELLSTMLGNVTLWFRLKGIIKKVAWKDLTPFVCAKECFEFFLPGVAVQIYTGMNKVLLWELAGDQAQSGFYEQAIKIIHFCTSLLSAYSTLWFPKMSKLFYQKVDDEKIKQSIRTGTRFVGLLGFPIVAGIAVITPQFVAMLLGNEFMAAVPLIRIMLPQILIVGISTALGQQFYNASGRHRTSMWIVTAGACLNILMNALIIPHLAAIGAAMVSLVTELFVTVLFCWFARKYFSIYAFFRDCRKHLMVSIIMGYLVYQIPGEGVAVLIIRITIGVIIYICGLAIVRDPDFAALWEMLRRSTRKETYGETDNTDYSDEEPPAIY